MKTHWPIQEVSRDGRKTRYKCGCGQFKGSWKLIPANARKAYLQHERTAK